MNGMAAIISYINSNLDTPLNELIERISWGPNASDTPPENTSCLWIDTSTEVATFKYYDSISETWKPINLGSSGGSVNSDSCIELDSDIED